MYLSSHRFHRWSHVLMFKINKEAKEIFWFKGEKLPLNDNYTFLRNCIPLFV